MPNESAYERRVRTLARRNGYRLWKPRSSGRSREYGPYTLIHAGTDVIMYHFKGVSLAEIEAFPGSHSDHEAGATRVVVGLPLCSRLLGRQRRPCVSLDASPTLRASIV